MNDLMLQLRFKYQYLYHKADILTGSIVFVEAAADKQQLLIIFFNDSCEHSITNYGV